MKKFFASTIFSGFLLLALCGCAAPQENLTQPDAPQRTELPERLLLKPGEYAAITLEGNPTTGYTWQVCNETPQVVSISEAQYFADSDLCGAPGQFRWTVTALAPGEAKLVFRYCRPWEGFHPEQDCERIYWISVPQP